MSQGPFQAPVPSGGAIGGRPSVPMALVSNVPAYRTPNLHEENGYMDSPVGAYAPVLRVSESDSTPDARRIGQGKLREYGPEPARPPDEWYQGTTGPGRDSLVRHQSAEQIVSAPHHEHRGTGYGLLKRAAPDPRRTPPPETRYSSDLSPAGNYIFTRPFGQHIPHRLTGQRFSMADHRRKYEDMVGMNPQTTRRNTYRVDPGPWDQVLTDYPVNTPADWGGYRTAAVPSPPNRTGRLDSY